MSLTEFWNSTRRETLMFIQAYRWRMEGQQRQALSQAWHIAALAGATFSKSGLPPLAQIVPPDQKAQPQLTLEQEAAMWKAWAQDHNARWKAAS